MTNRQLLVVIMAALGGVFMLCVTAALIWGPQDLQTQLTEVGGGLVAWLTVGGGAAYLLRDRDGDGIPDIIQPGGLFGPKVAVTIERPPRVYKNGDDLIIKATEAEDE